MSAQALTHKMTGLQRTVSWHVQSEVLLLDTADQQPEANILLADVGCNWQQQHTTKSKRIRMHTTSQHFTETRKVVAMLVRTSANALMQVPLLPTEGTNQLMSELSKVQKCLLNFYAKCAAAFSP